MVALIAAAAGVLAMLWRLERRLRHTVNRLAGDGPERPGALVRLDRVEAGMGQVRADVSRVLAELSPDHGGSLRDAVDRVEVSVSRLEGRQEQTQELLERHIASPHPRRRPCR